MDTFKNNKGQLKQALQTIINLHEQYSKAHIGALGDIVDGFGFSIDEDLSLNEKEKPNEEQDVRQLVEKYHKIVFDEESSDPLPFKVCPNCGSTKLERGSNYIKDDLVLFIKCSECGWIESQIM